VTINTLFPVVNFLKYVVTDYRSRLVWGGYGHWRSSAHTTSYSAAVKICPHLVLVAGRKFFLSSMHLAPFVATQIDFHQHPWRHRVSAVRQDVYCAVIHAAVSIITVNKSSAVVEMVDRFATIDRHWPKSGEGCCALFRWGS